MPQARGKLGAAAAGTGGRETERTHRPEEDQPRMANLEQLSREGPNSARSQRNPLVPGNAARLDGVCGRCRNSRREHETSHESLKSAQKNASRGRRSWPALEKEEKPRTEQCSRKLTKNWINSRLHPRATLAQSRVGGKGD
jgi:hypothetical protein